MRISFLILIFVLTLAINEVSSVKEVRDFVKNLIKQVLQPSSPAEFHQPKEDYRHDPPIRENPNGYVKELHDKLFHSPRKPYIGGHFPGSMEEEVYSTTTVDEETSPWEVKDQESHSESPLKETLDIPGDFSTSRVGDYEKGSTTQLPPQKVAGKNTPAVETHSNPTEISMDDVLLITRPLIPEVEEGDEKYTPSQKDVASDIYLPSVPISSHEKVSNNSEEISTEGEDLKVHEKGDLTEGRVYDYDDNYKIIFKGNYVKTTPAPLEAGYTVIYEYD